MWGETHPGPTPTPPTHPHPAGHRPTDRSTNEILFFFSAVFMCALVFCVVATATAVRLPMVRTVSSYGSTTFSAAVVPAAEDGDSKKWPPIVMLPPIGVGIDRTFCGRFVDAWAADEAGELHVIDVLGMGDSTPKPVMKRSLTGGWDVPPRTPEEWARQTLHYVREEVGEPCVIVGQSNLCTVALECSRLDSEQLVRGIVLLGPPAVEALTIDKPHEAIDKVWRITGSPIGAALYRFARRKAFLASFSKKNLFADPAQVDDDYLETCAAGASDADTRHAVFSFVAGTWRKDYRALLNELAIPTLVISGRDVGASAADGGGVGKAPPPPKPEASEVDRTSFGNLLKWFKVWRRSDEQEAGRFDQVGRDLGMDPEAKLRDYVGAMGAAAAAGCVETALLPGWNVLVYESPAELAACIGGFVRRRFGGRD